MIFFQNPLSEEEIIKFKNEFPHIPILQKHQRKSDSHIEIFYGDQLCVKELDHLTQLRWIHCPHSDLEGLCLKEIKKKETILITKSKGENIAQMAEYVMGGILAFAKQFFLWKQVPHEPEEFWDWPLKETLWTLEGKTLLQIGLGQVGSAIVYRANSFGMRTWGVKLKKTFHPFCKKTFSMEELHSLLPHADVVCLSLPKGVMPHNWFTKQQLELMKKDSLLIIIGSSDIVDEQALFHVAKTNKFRGILMDSFQDPPPPKHSLLWKMPGGILTPHIACYPLSEKHSAFQDFRHNLKYYLNKEPEMMRHRVH